MCQPSPLKLAFVREHPAELAALLARQGTDAIMQALEDMPSKDCAALAASLPHARAVEILSAHEDETVKRWLDEADLDHALSVLLHLDAPRRTRVLDQLSSRGRRRRLRRLATYPASTVGSQVDPSVLSLDVNMPLTEAVDLLRAEQPEADRSVWLVDESGHYVGLLDSGQALVARSDRLKLREVLMELRPVRADVSLAQACGLDEWLEHPELPVVDHRGHMLGVLSRARLMSALQGAGPTDKGVVDDIGEVTRQYFRVMGSCLGELLGLRGRER
ncbi:MAG: hypothetical protein U5L08_15370 [Xanthomonadales bacterium]|nr:hypothetical protein [Xanthomonadales bacterium]